MVTADDNPNEAGSTRLFSGRDSREQILWKAISRIAEHGRVISTGYHAELHQIAKEAALRLGGVTA